MIQTCGSLPLPPVDSSGAAKSLARWNVLLQCQMKSEYPILKSYDQTLSLHDFRKFKFGNKGSIEMIYNYTAIKVSLKM